MLELNYWEVLEGNGGSVGAPLSVFHFNYKNEDKWIFKSKVDYLSPRNLSVVYLEDFFENLDKPTSIELSLFELNTGVRLRI